jgi:hypothetical protein
MDVLAHYIWPPRWIGAAPKWLEDVTPVQLEDLSEVIRETTLPGDLRARAFRDGMLAYDFTPRGGRDSATGSAEGVLRDLFLRVRTINAHLACLQAVIDQTALRVTIATIWRTLKVRFDDGSFIGGNTSSDGGAILDLYTARLPFRAQVEEDWRYERWQAVVTGDQIERSYELLGQLLARPEQRTTLLRAELILRATEAALDCDYSGAVAYAWTVIEGLLGDLFKAYTRESPAKPNADRRKRLSREMTAWHQLEILSLTQQITAEQFETADICRKRRNAWLHDHKEATPDDADDALKTARAWFARVEGVNLAPGLDTDPEG